MDSIVIKTGGNAAESLKHMAMMAREIQKLREDAVKIVVKHGGGGADSSIQQQYHIEPHFVDGRRMTSIPEMDLVDMGLAGLMNKKLVRLFHSHGLNAVGLSGADGGIILSHDALPLAEGGENRTGSVKSVNPALIHLLLEQGYLPVLSSVSSDASGRGMNINADEAALAVAAALNASDLIFISDIPGILIDGQVKSSMNEDSIEAAIVHGDIQGGMIPKVRSSLAAIRQGVKSIQISNYEQPGDLLKIINGNKGSCISL